MSNGGQNGAQGFDTHGDVQEVSGIEEVVVMSKQRHQHVPNKVEEGLKEERGLSVTRLLSTLHHHASFTYIVSEHNTKLPDLVLNVNGCYPTERKTCVQQHFEL